MRRKVIQDFANVFCQRIAQLPEGYDLASFAHYGSGTYELDILTGNCTLNGKPIPGLRTCDVFREWLFKQLDKHRIVHTGIKLASLTINVSISEVDVKLSLGHEFASAYYEFDCRSEIRTDEKTYTAQLNHEQTWGFDWFYQQLYGCALPLSRGQSQAEL